MVNIPEKDVKTEVKERYNKIYEIPSELLDIIKNNGTSINGQRIIESLYNYKKSKVKNLTPERDLNYFDQAIEEAFHIIGIDSDSQYQRRLGV